MPRRIARNQPRQMIRAFVAVELNEVLKDRLAEAAAQLAGAGGDVKWVERENRHLTLKFLGDIEWLAVGEYGQALAEAVKPFAPFALTFKGVLPFPPGKRPRVVAVGIEDSGGRLPALVAVLEMALAGQGVKREERAFRPHVTLGRLRSWRGSESLWRAAEAWGERRFGELRVGKVTFFRSELSASGPAYTVLSTASLGG